MVDYTTRDEHFVVPLSSNYVDLLHEISDGSLVPVKKFRPRSVCTVYQYADEPMTPSETKHGITTKTSILRSLARRKSASNGCTRDSWVRNNERLCEIRYYYKETKAHVIEPKYRPRTGRDDFLLRRFLKGTLVKPSLVSPIDTKQSVKQETIVGKSGTRLSSESEIGPLVIRGQTSLLHSFRDKSVNTPISYYSMKHWHGAEWQHRLPSMYQPSESKYDSYASKPVRTKWIQTRHRDTTQMFDVAHKKLRVATNS